MSKEPIEIKIDNQEVNAKLFDLAKCGENLRPLMKNIAGIFSYSTEENFKEEGRPDKWVGLSGITQERRKEKGHWPGLILQVEGQLAASIDSQYDDNSAIIGSNKDYAAIHQFGGIGGRNKKVKIPARPYLVLNDDDFEEIIEASKKFLK